MNHIANYLKPFAGGMIVAILLLFVQCFCDLNLPNYMSDIVNVGLQQQGIDHTSPKALTPEALTLMTSFMTEEEQDVVTASYSLADASYYLEAYPQYTGDSLYVLTDSSDLTTLDSAFSYASWTFVTMMQDMAATTMNNATADMNSIDMNAIDMEQLSAMVSMIPGNLLESYITTGREADLTFATQTGFTMVSSFYTELGVDLTTLQQDYIMKIGLYMLLIAFTGGIATVMVSFITSRAASGVARNLREQLFHKINSFSHEEFDRFSTSSLITRSTNDVQQIQQFCMMGLRAIFFSPIMLIGGVYMALDKSISMAWVIALACICVVGFISIIMVFVMPKFKIMQSLVDRINLVARETLNGLMVIKAFGTMDHEKERFKVANENYAGNNLSVNKAMTTMIPVMTLVMNLTSVLIVWVGAKQIDAATMQVGDMMAYMQYAMQIIMSFLMIGMMFVFIPRAIVSAQRINEVLTTEPVIQDPKCSQVADPDLKGVVSFKNVSFCYTGAEEPALDSITFTAKPGETVAFIGSTGSGKSTLLNLIPRFYDVTKGSVSVGGVDVREMTQFELHQKLGYVPQKSILMSGTIESNIKYGDDTLSNDKMRLAAAISQSTEFIEEKEDLYSSHISQGGSNVSGGQRQRLSIARALAISPDIYLFDDSFSALDYKTDVTLRTALKQQVSDATVIIVAQRVGTILDADVIHVLEDGKIIGSGTHKQLLTSCPAYYEIASTQLSKEELDYA